MGISDLFLGAIHCLFIALIVVALLQPMLLKFANLWKDLAGFDQSNLETFQNYGYYTTLLRGNLRLVALMTNYMWVFSYVCLLVCLLPHFQKYF